VSDVVEVPDRPLQQPLERDPFSGQYVSKKHPRCGVCGYYLAEDLLGRLRCLHRTCAQAGQVIGMAPGVTVSPELIAALTADKPAVEAGEETP
jgi:hypothetical protein